MTDAFRALLRMDVRAGAEAEFEREWRQIAEATTARPECRAQWLARDTTQESVYLVVTDWVDEAGFRAFEHSPEHVDNRRRLDRYRVGGAMDTMQLVANLRAANPRAEGSQGRPGPGAAAAPAP